MNVDTSRMRRSPPRRARRKKKKDNRDVFSRLYETNTESLAQSPWSPDGGNLIHVGGVGVNGVNSSYLSNNSSYSSDEEGNCFSVTSMRSMPATATALISPTSRLLKPTVASIHSMAQRKLDSLHLETSVTESEKPARDRIVKGPMKRRTPRPIQSTPPTIQHFHHSWHNVPPKVNSFNHRPAPPRRQHPVGENGNNKHSNSSNGLGHNEKKPQQRSSAAFAPRPITRPKPKPTPQPKPTPTRKKTTTTTTRPKAKATTKTPPSTASPRTTTPSSSSAFSSPARKNTLSSPARTIATETSSLASATPSPLRGGAARKDDPHNDSLCLDDVVANHDDAAVAVAATPAAAATVAAAAATLDYAAVPQPLEDDEWPSQQVGVDLFRQKSSSSSNNANNNKLSRPDAEDALLEWYPTRLVHIALMAHEEELLQRNSVDGATAAAASLAEDVDEDDFVDLFLFVAYFHHLFDEFIFFDEEEDRRISRDEFVRVVVEQLGMTTVTAQGAFDQLVVAGQHDNDDLFDGDGDGFCSFDDLCRFCVDRHDEIVQQKRGGGGGGGHDVVDGTAAQAAAASAEEEEELNAALASSRDKDDRGEEEEDKNSPTSQEADSSNNNNNNNNNNNETEEEEKEEAQHTKEDEERKKAGRKSEINLPRRSEMLRAFDFMDVEETGMVTRVEFEQFIRKKGRPEWNNKEAIDLAFVALNPQSHHHEGSGFIHRDDFPFLLLYIVYHIHFKEKYTDFVKVDSSQSGDYGEMLVDSSSNHTTNTTTTTRQGVRVIPQGEFVLAGISVRLPNISQAYKVVKKTDEGQVLFHEFCAYCASKRLEGTESEDGNSNKG